MKRINKALASSNAENLIFYVDEGKKTRIPTPGQNRQNYLTEALNINTGQVVQVKWEKKFIYIFEING